MSIVAKKYEIFERTDSGAGHIYWGWKVYVNGKKYPLNKGECYSTEESEEGKQKAIAYAMEDIVNNLQGENK